MKNKWYRLKILTSEHTGYYPSAYLKQIKGKWFWITDKKAEIEEWKVVSKEEIKEDC